MVTYKGITLRVFIAIVFKINFNAAVSFNSLSSESSVNILSKLLDKPSHSPLVIVINKPSVSNAILRSLDTPSLIDDVKNKISFDTVDEEKTKHYMLDILRSTGDENDPTVKATNMKFERALRSRCTVYFECVIKCEPIQLRKKKKNCKKSCQEVYDYLMLCNPPAGGKKSKIHFCESWEECGGTIGGGGKTMPPTWRY